MFYSQENYAYFLRLFKKYLGEHIEVLAYALLKNHFHFLIRVKSETDIDVLNKGFRSFFISYSQAINKERNRMGSLFMKPFKRKKIEDTSYLSNLIAYIHLNPTLHNDKIDFRDYKWSSYLEIIEADTYFTNTGFSIEWFGGLKQFKSFHEARLDFKKIEALIIE